MMLLGGFLTGAAAWVIIIEMRGRVRMVDTLAKTGEREAMIAPAAPELPVLDAPLDVPSDPLARREPVWDPDTAAATYQARVEAQQVNAASMLEASSKLLTAFSNVLRSFGQLPAQVAMLAVALAASRSRPGRVVCVLWTAGILIFSGSLYVLAATGLRWLGAITPFGGLCFLTGWLILAVTAVKDR